MRFLMEDQNVPLEKVVKIRNLLLDRAGSLAVNPYVGQYEEYLEHLEKDIEGWWRVILRSFTGSRRRAYTSRIFLIQGKARKK